MFKFHNKCRKDRPALEVLGEDLNKLKEIDAKFEPNKKYLVCRNLFRSTIAPIIKQKSLDENQSNEIENSDLNEGPPTDNPIPPSQQSTSVPRCGFTTNFPMQVLKECESIKIRKGYMDLSNSRCRKNRVNAAAQKILAYNVCSKELQEKGMNYLVGNTNLANDLAVFMDAVKERIIQGVMRINLNEVSSSELRRPLDEDTEEQKIAKAMVILKETSQNGFSNIRQVFIESKEDLPSVYHIKKLRPKFEEKEIEPELVVIPEPSRTQSQELVHNKPVVVARIEGTYSDVVDRLEARRKRKYEEISSDEPTYNENYDIVLDSYDGAQMTANQKKKTT